MSIEIIQLCECPEHLDSVGTWIYEQWWQTADNTSEVVLSQLRNHTSKDTIPFTLVALKHQQPVGSCCVIENDCIHRPQYSPWVAAVYVKEEHRRCGIASRLLQAAYEIVKKTGEQKLYLVCHSEKVTLYQKNGWTILETDVGEKDSVVMLRAVTAEI